MSDTPRSRVVPAILVGGMVAGAFDITYAVVFSYLYRGTAPTRILQSVACGVLGKEAFSGGSATALLGLVLHFCNALIIAAIFVAAALRLPALIRRPVWSGACYGFAVFWVMNLVVLPLSAVPWSWKFVAPTVITGLLVHMFLIGVPIALAARRYVAPNSGAGMVGRH